MLAVTKIYALTKLLASTKLLTSKKYRCWQNIGVDKISALTKYWRRQNPAIDKISWRQQNLGVNKRLAQTKRWRRRRRIPLLFGSAESPAADFSQAPPEDLLRLSDGVALFACSRQVRHCLQPPCFYLCTFSGTVLVYCTSPICWKCQKKFGRRQNISVRLKFTEEGVWA